MPGEDDGDGPRGQLPPFTPPKFNWNQHNLYEQFKTFKRVVEFTFKGQYEVFRYYQMWFYLELAWSQGIPNL